MAIRSRDEIARDMRSRTRTLLPGANTSRNSVLGDIFIDVPSEQLARIYGEVDSISQRQSILTSTGLQLDALASNYGKSRNTATKSSGTLLLTRSQLKNSEVVVIRAGSIVSTLQRGQSSGRTVVEFRTLSEITLDGRSRAVYQATANRYRTLLDQAGINDPYAIEVEIEALIPGGFTNVGRFTVLRHNIANVNNVINPIATTGGQNVEADTSFRQRLLLALSGNSPESANGYLARVLDNINVEDAILIGPGNELMLRDGTLVDESGNITQLGTGGAIDIIIRGELLSAPESGAESFIFQNKNLNSIIASADNDYVLGQKTSIDSFGQTFNVNFNSRRVSVLNSEDIPNQPVTNITSVVGEKSGNKFVAAYIDEFGVERGSYRLLKDINAKDIFNKDASGPFANSPFGFDRLVWISDEANSGNEEIVRAPYNTTDATLYEDIVRINSLVQPIILSNQTGIIETEEFTLGEVTSNTALAASVKPVRVIKTQNYPTSSIKSVTNSRTEERYVIEEVDHSIGEIIYSGRIFPNVSDDVQITYTWVREFDPTHEFRLNSDRIKWSDRVTDPGFVDDLSIGNDIGVILEPTSPDDNGIFYAGGADGIARTLVGDCIEEDQSYLTQPDIPTHLRVVGNGSGLTTKELTINGTTITTVLDQEVVVPDQIFTIDSESNSFFGYWILDLAGPTDRDGNLIGGSYPITVGPDVAIDSSVGYVSRDSAFLEILNTTTGNIIVVDDFVTLRDDIETKGFLTTTKVAINSESVPSPRDVLEVSFVWKVPNPQCKFASGIVLDSDGIPCRVADNSDFLYECNRGFVGSYEANCSTGEYDLVTSACEIYRADADNNICDNVNCPSYTSALLDDELNLGNFETIRFAGNTSSAGIPQISGKRYSVVDRLVTSTDSNEKLTIISIDTFNQPEPNKAYVADYDFKAPKENERITVNYNYNKLVGDLQLSIEGTRSVTADVLVKEGRDIEVELDADLVIDPDLDPVAKGNEVSDALVQLFTSDSLGGKIDPSDVIFVAKSISGVDDIQIRKLAKSGEVGVKSLVFANNEYFSASRTGIILTVFNSLSNPTQAVSSSFISGEDPSKVPTGVVISCPQKDRGDVTTTCS